MAERRLHPEWRDYNQTTKYPFADHATLTNADGVFLPEGTLLDAILYPVGGTDKLYLSQVQVTNELVTLVIADNLSDRRCYGSFDLVTPPDSVPLVDDYGRAAGLLVSESARLAVFQSWAAATHSFTQDQTEFAASCCVPTPEIGVRGLLLDDGSLVVGDAWLVGEDGVVLRPQQRTIQRQNGETETQQVIRVDVVGDPLFRRRLCDDSFAAPTFLRTLTVKTPYQEVVCGPDERGDFKLAVSPRMAPDTVLRVRTTPQGLLLEVVGRALV